MRTILLLFFGLFSGLSFAQNRQKDLAAFNRQYILDSIVSFGQRYLDRYPERTRERNRVVCRVINTETRQGNFQKVYETCEAELRATDDPVQRAYLYRELGLTNKLDEYLDRAQLYCVKALKLMQLHREYEGEVILLTDLGELSRKIIHHEEGNEYLRKALKIAEQHHVSDPRVLAQLYNRLAAIANETAKQQECVRLTKIALRYAEQVNDYHLQAVSWNELGYCYGNIGPIEESIAAYQKAVDLWMKAYMYQDAALPMFNSIEGQTHRGDFSAEEAILRFEELLHFLRKHNVTFLMYRVYGHLTDLYKSLGNYKKAYEYSELRRTSESAMERKADFRNLDRLREQFQNDLLKKEAEASAHRLKSSQQLVVRKQQENTIAVIVLAILGLLLTIIGLLYYRTRRDKRILQREAKIKDSLIQEIHHRVKNNLQFVSSLMNMQVNASSNDSEIYALNDASRRIKSMALVHEMLYNYDDKQTVSLKKYTEELIETLKDLSSAQQQSVRFVTNVADIQVSVGQSVALGMICSELVANALKHAFVGNNDPCIELTVMIDAQGVCHFELRDNGPGLQHSEEHKPSLGMRLIDIFSRQLKGSYVFSNNNGLVFDLSFHP